MWQYSIIPAAVFQFKLEARPTEETLKKWLKLYFWDREWTKHLPTPETNAHDESLNMETLIENDFDIDFYPEQKYPSAWRLFLLPMKHGDFEMVRHVWKKYLEPYHKRLNVLVLRQSALSGDSKIFKWTKEKTLPEFETVKHNQEFIEKFLFFDAVQGGNIEIFDSILKETQQDPSTFYSSIESLLYVTLSNEKNPNIPMFHHIVRLYGVDIQSFTVQQKAVLIPAAVASESFEVLDATFRELKLPFDVLFRDKAKVGSENEAMHEIFTTIGTKPKMLQYFQKRGFTKERYGREYDKYLKIALLSGVHDVDSGKVSDVQRVFRAFKLPETELFDHFELLEGYEDGLLFIFSYLGHNNHVAILKFFHKSCGFTKENKKLGATRFETYIQSALKGARWNFNESHASSLTDERRQETQRTIAYLEKIR